MINIIMKKHTLKYILSIIALSISMSSLAQDFKLLAELDTIGTSGYYNIQLPPQTEALSKVYDLGDIRIKDNKGTEIPYFVHSENPVSSVSYFDNYKIKENKVKDSFNILVIDNTKQEMIDRFCVIIGNADVKKYASVRGSNDLSQWYIVKQKTAVSANYFDDNSQIVLLDVPKGNYKYYEITLNNNQKSPFNVKEVGRISNSSIYGQFTKVDAKLMAQKDSTNKVSYLRFPDVPFNYHINKIAFKINAKTDYLRDARLIDDRQSVGFVLNSKGENTFFLNNFRISNRLEIQIENGDNSALQIDSVSFYSLNRYLCAYLEADKKYTLYVGNKKLSKPNYDIEYFRKDIPNNLRTIHANKITIADDVTPIPEVKQKPSLFETPIFLWSVIIIVGLFLIFICIRLITEMKKK